MRSTSAMPRDDLQALIAIRREQHVARAQRHALRNRHRLFAQGPDVERDLAGALIALHAIVEQARQQHVPQADLQVRGIEMRIPWPHRIAVVVEHPHQIDWQRTDVARTRVDVGPLHRAGGRELHIAEIGRFARSGRRMGQVQARVLLHPRNLRLSGPECCIHSGPAE